MPSVIASFIQSLFAFLQPFPISSGFIILSRSVMGAQQCRWLAHLVSTFIGLWRQPPGRQPPEIRLPPEIILLIADHLDTTSRVLFALTCKKLHSLCFPSKLNLTHKEKQALLLLMEKDTPRHYFCHCCTLLHPWRLERSGPSGWISLDHMLCNPADYRSMHTEMEYTHARLIMNRHFYGKKHGLSPKIFHYGQSLFCNPTVYGLTGNYTSTWRIIDDKLMNMRVLNINGSYSGIRHYLEYPSRKPCGHLLLEQEYCKGTRVQLPELREGLTTRRTFDPCYQSRGSCSVCLTDYCIDIIPGRKGNYNIRLLIYNQLGECRSPYDWEWQIMIAFYRLPKAGPRKAFPIEYGTGAIMDRWNGADGVASGTQSRWVETQGMRAWKRV
jgi:hypothetical protein